MIFSLLLRFRIELGHAWFERVCFSCETYALLCGNCHVSKGKLFSLVNGHTAIYVLKSLPLETWQFPHSNAYVSHEKHTRSNHACPSSIRNRSTHLLTFGHLDFLVRSVLFLQRRDNGRIPTPTSIRPSSTVGNLWLFINARNRRLWGIELHALNSAA